MIMAEHSDKGIQDDNKHVFECFYQLWPISDSYLPTACIKVLVA